MTKIVFSFDTEDYVNEAGAEGIINVAEILEAEGCKGCFQIVALMAKALKEWGRDDIIERLKSRHEVDYHSYAHSMHPTINEYTDLADFDTAIDEFFKQEKRGAEIVKEIFGVDGFASVTPPGSSTSYVAHYGYAEMGIPIYTMTPSTDKVKNRPTSACNINCISYSQALDRFLMDADENAMRALLDEAAQKEIFVFYHHPQMHLVDAFWDKLNFDGKNTPKKDWILSSALSKEASERFCNNFRLLLRLIKSDGRFEITTFADIAKTLSSERKIYVKDVPIIAEKLNEAWFPLTTPESLSLSDIFLAALDFLDGKNEHVCGKVYGFLSEPYAITEPVFVTRGELCESTSQLNGIKFLPEFIYAGGKKLGPADWLRAALAVLLGAEGVTLTPMPWQIDLDEFPQLKKLSYKNVWVHMKELEDKFLSDRFRLQSWTLRLPKGSKRKIF